MNSAPSAVPSMGGSANDIALPTAGMKRTRQQRDRDERLQQCFTILQRAANNGCVCPSNEALASMLGYAGPSKPCDLMALLVTMGFITVESGHNARVVTIVKTGKRTAGSIGKPRTRIGWTEDEDAMLMDGMAESLTFDAIAKILRKTRNACISRFRKLATRMGGQAV